MDKGLENNTKSADVSEEWRKAAGLDSNETNGINIGPDMKNIRCIASWMIQPYCMIEEGLRKKTNNIIDSSPNNQYDAIFWNNRNI